MKHGIYILSIISLFVTSSVFAQGVQDTLTAFRQVITIEPPAILVPTVVELPLAIAAYERNTFAVYDATAEEFVPYFVKDVYTQNPTPLKISAAGKTNTQDTSALTDNKSETSVEYLAEEGKEETVRFTIVTNTPIESSSLFLELDTYVLLPSTISISARVDGFSDKLVLARTPFVSTTVHFPETRSAYWTITLSYTQPLRINELHLIEDTIMRTMTRSVRFLAQPGSHYAFYHDADRGVHITTGESGNLYDNTGIFKLYPLPSFANSAYDALVVAEVDSDTDLIPDVRDNCKMLANFDQIDIDKNGIGDACDDFDKDGVIESQDNCPTIPNVRQEDTDGDEIGDVCDTDESLFTEKYLWVPWVGMGIALLVLCILFMLVLIMPKTRENKPRN